MIESLGQKFLLKTKIIKITTLSAFVQQLLGTKDLVFKSRTVTKTKSKLNAVAVSYFPTKIWIMQVNHVLIVYKRKMW